ncbi:EamA family transporter [Salinibaculum salinum]|uniref:EamA family transporter n=1 Tax=Salinibaculum salinum TaxID=3131996 RepID=UPI0030EEDB20
MPVSPLVLALIAMVSWGVWTAMVKVATETADPTVAMILSYVTSIFVAVTYVWFNSESVVLSGAGAGWSLVSGIFAGVGAIAFYSGIANGQVGTVTTISALYFVVAAFIGIVMFGDSLGLQEIVGFLFAGAAVALLAG